METKIEKIAPELKNLISVLSQKEQYLEVYELLKKLSDPIQKELAEELIIRLSQQGYFEPAYKIAKIINRELTRQELVWIITRCLDKYAELDKKLKKHKFSAGLHVPILLRNTDLQQLFEVLCHLLCENKYSETGITYKPPKYTWLDPTKNIMKLMDQCEKDILQVIVMLPEDEQGEWITVARTILHNKHFGEKLQGSLQFY